MAAPSGKRKFHCEQCDAPILVPLDLPATSAPCPVCHVITTSPAPEGEGIEEPSGVDDPQAEVEDAEVGSRFLALLIWGLFLAALLLAAVLLSGLLKGEAAQGETPRKTTSPQPAEAADQAGQTNHRLENDDA